MGQELKALKKVLKTKSQAQVAVELGYRSATTIFYWLRINRIPASALGKVRRYLEKVASHDNDNPTAQRASRR